MSYDISSYHAKQYNGFGTMCMLMVYDMAHGWDGTTGPYDNETSWYWNRSSLILTLDESYLYNNLTNKFCDSFYFNV